MHFSEKYSRRANAFTIERPVMAATTKEKKKAVLKLLIDESQAPSITLYLYLQRWTHKYPKVFIYFW